ncbi:UNVERIFIED_CONTAM: hypothetical protein PYX00_009137 [Menopon gallinae]|uniref:PDEase domain-containing protein n=1 Tax=Menopon gallinae TaxID=328185 RepID=A0AAW2HAB8_9NEOP
MMQSIAHRKIEIIRACSNMSSELVNYHMAKGQEELQLLFTYEPRIYYREMFDFQWTCRQVAWSDTISCLLSMFHHLGFAKSLNISKTTLLTFIMTARVTYRDLPYHNWAHAFSVAHFSFVLMHHLQLIRRCLITEVEGAAFFISALCHDLDHRGTTNSFQIIANNSLAYLYGSEGSILERHHFSTTLRILNTDNCNLFENFTVPQYARVVNLIRDMIVATDMNQHLQILPEQRKAISLGTYEPGKKYHRFLLTSLMMTCCDLNDQVKGWIYCRDVAEKISLEFFNQGDMEKEMGRTPVDMMDRDRAFIPRVQLNFVNDICVPCYTVVVSLFPELEGLLDSIKDTAYRWKRAIEWFKLNAIPENLSLGFIFNSDLVQYVLER